MKIFFRNKRKNKIFGGIDLISCGIIRGWVISKEIPLVKIKFLYGNITITSCEIDLVREDVNKKYFHKGNSGFNLFLPSSFKIKNNQTSLKIVVFDNKDEQVAELKLFKDPINTSFYLLRVLESKVVGQYGRFEFFNNRGDLIGWSGFFQSNEVASVWIRSEGLKPISFICNRIKSSVINGIDDNCGFIIELNKLPKEFLGNDVKLTFDEEGFFPLINLPEKLILKKIDCEIRRKSRKLKEDKDNKYQKDFKIYRENINNFKKYLDLKFNLIEVSKNKKESIFGRYKKNLFYFFKK